MSRAKFLSLSPAVCVLMAVAGCAQIVRVESIKPDLNVVRMNSATRNAKVAIEPFKINGKDQKENVIGEAKIGLVNSKADIVSGEAVSGIVSGAVEKGFRDAGFTVVEKGAADFTVTGTVEKFWVEEYATGLSFEYSKASVRYDLIMRNRQGATLWANTLDVFKTSDKSMDTTENNLPTLSAALKESVESIFGDQTFWSAIAK